MNAGTIVHALEMKYAKTSEVHILVDQENQVSVT
jgi:hypothetical protein